MGAKVQKKTIRTIKKVKKVKSLSLDAIVFHNLFVPLQSIKQKFFTLLIILRL